MKITKTIRLGLIGNRPIDQQRFWTKACIEKVRYNTKKKTKLKAKENGARFGERLYIYRCANCLGYHLTKKED